jgi:hypothetical protein
MTLRRETRSEHREPKDVTQGKLGLPTYETFRKKGTIASHE